MNMVYEVCNSCPDKDYCVVEFFTGSAGLSTKWVFAAKGKSSVWQVPEKCTRKLEHLVIGQAENEQN